MLLEYLSVGLGVFGIVIAAVQSLRMTRLDNVRRTEIAEVLNRIKMMILTNEDALRITSTEDKRELVAWVWKRQRGLSDMYSALVRQYISTEREFPYSQIARLVAVGIIDSRWQESVWREISALRVENVKAEPPPYVFPGGKPDEWGRHPPEE